jgi:hypothetical protein
MQINVKKEQGTEKIEKNRKKKKKEEKRKKRKKNILKMLVCFRFIETIYNQNTDKENKTKIQKQSIKHTTTIISSTSNPHFSIKTYLIVFIIHFIIISFFSFCQSFHFIIYVFSFLRM